MIIAVDGPAAAGKGTLARTLAETLGLPYLDTGLLYRATGRAVLDVGGDLANPLAAEAAARALHPDDLARTDLRGPEADAAAAAVAAVPGVRATLLAFQRRVATERGAVLDGRDIGTVVFPDADVKFYVIADLDARAARRHAELLARDPASAPAVTQVREDLLARDTADAARLAAPLRQAADAILIDTTALGPAEVVARAIGYVRARHVPTRPG